jgi:NAD+ synthase (glutamine-hydrolysing)
MRIALIQTDVTVGDFEGNIERVLRGVSRAAAEAADLALAPELALTGYPPEDLLAREDFLERAAEAVRVVAGSALVPTVVGAPDRHPDGGLANAAVLVADGRIRTLHRKRLLPNYGVFDEKRYFTPGDRDTVVEVVGVPVALTVCEDIWDEQTAERLAAAGARVICNISASPFHVGKGIEREQMLRRRASDNGAWIVYCNLVGGQDELVFDGRSVVVAPDGTVVARAASFAEDVMIVDMDLEQASGSGPLAPLVEGPEEVYRALTLGLSDYIRKNGFTDVVLGLSGGIDSAVVATIAADALGPEHVHAVLMPGPYSSEGSVTDALALADALGIEALTLPIGPAFDALRETLRPVFGDALPDVTEENIQARVRGTLLMALSNRFGWLVLATGNKSELSVGYSTLYGDMVGGFAPIKDVFKTRVYELARWRNEQRAVIPDAVLAKAPSAELRPNQTDQDTLPPYDVLDAVLAGYVERDMGAGELVAAGHDPDTVLAVIRMVDAAEYKRRQGPLGIRVTPKAFGRDRRMPITNGFRG